MSISLTPAALSERLQQHHARTVETPLFNPVFQLSLDISRLIESGAADLSAIGGLVEALFRESLAARARHLDGLLAPIDDAANLAAFQTLVEQSAQPGDFAAFCARWGRPFIHAVFTAHPTFLLDSGDTAALVHLLDPAAAACDADVGPITLESEHRAAMRAIRRAGAARDALNRVIFQTAAQHWPDQWRNLRPMPLRLATWVGYDMDGRTDIGWATSIRFRLLEKAERLGLYADALRGEADDLAARLTAAEAQSRDIGERFADGLHDPDAVSAIANALTADHPAKLLSLAPVIADLESLADSADAQRAAALLTVAAAMRADGLGMGWVHFRLNSAQVENAIRRWIDPKEELELSSHAAGVRLRALLDDDTVLRSNFAALAIENTTAIRQFLSIAQIVHHIDADTPVRLLIAECEQPETILAALAFAQMFGVADHVDISPLFETESALEHGGRFLGALLAEPHYQHYVRKRGRLAIQTGFSDAGRFVGQIPAALAIERIHGHLARLMGEHALTDVAALIFNTHGESMGRGAHPGSMDDRMRYPMSNWARGRFAALGIATEMEVSYQGGDGYLLFGSDALALATLTRVAETAAVAPDPTPDSFYDRSGRSIDFYRGIRRVQRDFLASRTYARAITAFGLGLLNDTGSRKSRRQSDVAADRTMSLRQIRAIPHNAVLQQLGYPVNIIAGFGTAAEDDIEGVAAMLDGSPRGRQLLRMVRASNALASVKTAAAYGELFNSAYWASRPYRGHEPDIEDGCLALAELLTKDDRAGVFRRLVSRLRVDGLKLHRLLAKLDAAPPVPHREDTRRSLGALQALRLALIQHMFLRGIMVPAFSRRNDISREDMLEMIFTLRIDDAVALLRAAFPVSSPAISDFSVTEPSDYPLGEEQAYAGIQSEYVDPIADAHRLILRIGAAIANHFGAHG
jgi:phosphoenolpyruvate carboxylase